MRIRVVREPSIDGATLSVWFVDGHFACFGLEDAIREPETREVISSAWVRSWKVAGATAIPAATYDVVITPSQRFGRPLPLLVNVPGFSGIRIHPGNTIADTEGCLLPGRLRAAQRVGESRVACEKLLQKIEAAIAAGERVTVALENPEP